MSNSHFSALSHQDINYSSSSHITSKLKAQRILSQLQFFDNLCAKFDNNGNYSDNSGNIGNVCLV